MPIGPLNPILSSEILREHNADWTHKGVKNLKHGNDADKAADPDPGDVYLAEDTKMVYVSFEQGSWYLMPFEAHGLGHIEVHAHDKTISVPPGNNDPQDYTINIVWERSYTQTPILTITGYPTSLPHPTAYPGLQRQLVSSDTDGCTISVRFYPNNNSGTFQIRTVVIAFGK